MCTPDSKELYMMNGGNKLYIYKEGYGDIYHATHAEEELWSKEIIANALTRIDTEENTTALMFLIKDLIFHKFENIESLLISKTNGTSPPRQIVFATALWNVSKYTDSFRIIHENIVHQRSESLDAAFIGLNDFKDNYEARRYLVNCMEGKDETLRAKAQTTIVMWSYSGMPVLRDNNLTMLLHPKNKDNESFNEAIETLKKIFFKSKNKNS